MTKGCSDICRLHLSRLHAAGALQCRRAIDDSGRDAGYVMPGCDYVTLGRHVSLPCGFVYTYTYGSVEVYRLVLKEAAVVVLKAAFLPFLVVCVSLESHLDRDWRQDYMHDTSDKT